MTTATFANAVKTQSVRTENGMKAHAGAGDACVNLFYAIGAMRGKDILPLFKAAFAENADIALRIAQWSRDVRGGAGERQIFKDILAHLDAVGETESVTALINKVPEIGRWDDIFSITTKEARQYGFTLMGDAMRSVDFAKQMLPKVDTMSQDECRRVLDEVYNG